MESGPPSPDVDVRRMEVGAFLRARRNDLDPAGRGFVVARRRRAAGLLREEVASLAGVSTTWYTFLEQGRSINPSPSVVDHVMDVLELDIEQRSYVRRMLFGGRVEVDQPLVAADLVDDLMPLIGAAATPVYAANRNADLLGWNDAFEQWYGRDAITSRNEGSSPPNMLWWMVTSNDAHDRLPHWRDEIQDTIARVRGNAPSGAGIERRNELVRDLSADSEQFRVWWAEHQVLGHVTRHRHLRHPTLGLAVFLLVPLVMPSDPSAGFVVHYRADNAEPA